MGKQVFISSATGAIAPYRRVAVEVCSRLGLTPVNMESFSPDRRPPLDVCLRKVDESDIFLLLVAHRYGSRPDVGSRSYTELEYDQARRRPAMPLLVFTVDPRFPWDPEDIAQGADAQDLNRFRGRLHEHLVGRFGDLAEFKAELLLALMDHVNGTQAPEKPADLPAPPAFHAAPPYVGSAPFTGRAEALAYLDEWGAADDPVMVVEAIGGTGKSALTWQWATEHAQAAVPGLQGRLWWSFYDGSASMIKFLREALAYLTERPLISLQGLPPSDLMAQLVNALRARPHLLVLDGIERLLGAYHRFDPTKLRDDEVKPAERTFIDPLAEEVVHRFAAAAPSKILISTRLLPSALEGRFGRRAPGVRHLPLPGLTDEDTVAMLDGLGVRGEPERIRSFFQPLGNHPLLIGVVAGTVRRDRAHPGDFDGWLDDPDTGPDPVSSMNLVQRRTHILATALNDLPSDSDRLLGYISVLAGGVDWGILQALNPFTPGWPPVGLQLMTEQREDLRGVLKRVEAKAEERRKARLIAALEDLGERGLLWWDRGANTYDMHPVIRAYVYDRLQSRDRISVHKAVRDHFQALPPEDVQSATSVEDLRSTITLFRALVGGGEPDRAVELWRDRLSRVMLVRLGANSTAVELLSPVANPDHPLAVQDLARATRALRRYDAAIELTTSLLYGALGRRSVSEVSDALDLLGLLYRDTGEAVRQTRCLLLQGELLEAIGREPDESPTIVLRLADLAITEGRTGDAEQLLAHAATLPAPRSNPYHDGDLVLARLRLALAAGALTEEALAATTLRAWPHRAALRTLRRVLLTEQGLFEEALKAAEEEERLARNAGREVIPAVPAFLLARLGRRTEAEVAIELSLDRLPRLHPALRPHHAVARALATLGRGSEAAEHARTAYRQAWRDGPPYCHDQRLREASHLLEELGVAAPELPTVDAVTREVPHQPEIVAFIAERRRYFARSGGFRKG
jgi:tetratricopeptide (TPR) repeat protein